SIMPLIFFTATATPAIYTLSLHDALPILTIATFHEYLIWSSVVPAVPWITWVLLQEIAAARSSASQLLPVPGSPMSSRPRSLARSEEHTSELQSLRHLVCRLLLEKKKC